MSDENDFMGSLLHNYDTTENRMSDSAPGGSGDDSGSCEPSKQHIEVMGTPVSTSRSVIGLIVLIIGIIIGVAVMGEQETAMECFAGAAVVIAAIAGAFAIWLYKGK